MTATKARPYRKGVVLALLLALLAGGAGVALAASSAKLKPVRIAFIGPQANGVVFAVYRGVQVTAKKEGATVTRFDTGFDPTKQYNLIQDLITTKKFDVFFILPLDSAGLVPVVRQAIAAGIKVVNTNTPIGTNFSTSKPQVPGQSGSVIDPATKYGQWGAQLVVLACKNVDPCNVAWIAGVAALPYERAERYTFQGIFAKHPNIKLVAYQDGGLYLVDPGRQIAQNLLQAHPDLNVIATSGDQMAQGVELAAKDAGVATKLKIIGQGASTYGVQAVKDGRWYGTVIFRPFDSGKLAADIAIRAARGAKLHVGVSAVEKSDLPPIIYQGNLAKFKGFKGQWTG